MSNGKRTTGLFGAAGVLVAVLIISGFVIGGNFQVQAKGMLTVRVIDKPVELEVLDVEIDWVKIQSVDEGWIDLSLKTEEGTLIFDLLTLQDGVSETLTEDSIPVGEYSVIQIHVLSANATYLDEEGALQEDVELKVPSGVIKVLLSSPLIIEAEGDAEVIIDLQPDQNSIAVSHNLNLRPVIKAVVS